MRRKNETGNDEANGSVPLRLFSNLRICFRNIFRDVFQKGTMKRKKKRVAESLLVVATCNKRCLPDRKECYTIIHGNGVLSRAEFPTCFLVM